MGKHVKIEKYVSTWSIGLNIGHGKYSGFYLIISLLHINVAITQKRVL